MRGLYGAKKVGIKDGLNFGIQLLIQKSQANIVNHRAQVCLKTYPQFLHYLVVRDKVP
jgi:hypothetical protein